MISEIPITKNEEDLFERNNFACQVAEHLVLSESSPSLIVALEGKWGEGKTSTINLIKAKIRENNKDAAIIEFNPWLIGSLESVIEGFLVQLASGINQTFNSDVASKAAGKLLGFAKFLSPIKLIPGVEPWGTLVETAIAAVSESTKTAVDMADLNLLNRKEAVQKAIAELKKPIIVLIDDIDRLPPDEIRVVIQAVKAIGDFDRVSYLLAFEPEPIVKSLAYNDIYDGRRYLEKIIQASYPLPRIGYWHLKSFLNSHIKILLADIKLELSTRDKEILNEALDTTAIVRSLSSPRDVIRLVNRLRVTANNTREEVNFADTLAFETLELKYSTISEAIRRQPEIFLKTSIVEGDYITQDQLDDLTDRENKKDEPPLIKDLLSVQTPADIKNIRSILGFIFPSLFGEWDVSSHEEAIFNNRISTKESLLKLLHSGPTRYIYSSNEIKHFFKSENDRREILLDAFQAGVLPGWLQYASEFMSKASIVNSLAISDELIQIAETAHKENGQNLTDYIARFIIIMLQNIKDYEEKKKLLDHLSSNDKSLSLSEHILVRLLSKCKIWDSGIYKGIQEYADNELENLPINPVDLVAAKELWLSVLRREASKRDIISSEPEPISILFRWGQLNENNYAEVQEYVDKIIEKEKGLRAFIGCFHGGKGLSGIENLIGNRGMMIKKIDSLDEKPLFASEIREHLKAVVERSEETVE
ncbi:MAG: KAP family NTPase [Parachlamydia sp.]|nr:KAP family NTPase [Parachlamydia sp.]